MCRQVKDLSDDELEEYLKEVHGTTVTWVCESSAALEALRRYNNKKNECEILRAQSDRAVRDLQKVMEGLIQSLKACQVF